MATKQSPQSLIRELKDVVRNEREAAGRYARELEIARGQLTKARQETAEWKQRFDALLARVPLKGLPEAQ